MENTHIDPYAPPKSTLTHTNNTTYLEQDGYTSQNELVANHHFKSPLICAKLGIPIPPESNPQPKNITLTRISKLPKPIIPLIQILSFALLVVSIAYTRIFNPMPIILLYFISAYTLKRIFSKPYTIPFYFSEQYTHIRKRRKIIFTINFLILIAIFATGYITGKESHILFSVLCTVIALIILKFKTTYFVITQTKGEFHYIRGVHQGLLDALPHLHLSSQKPTTSLE